MIYVITFLSTLIAGFIQSVSGFGAGIIIMSVLPYFFTVLQASAICNFISIFLCAMITLNYKEHIKKELIVKPGIFFIIGATLAIYFSKSLNLEFLKLILGLFLIFLAFYFMLFNDKVQIKANLLTMFICGFGSGFCDGLFSIGGPLMVLYFLGLLKRKEEYLATISAFLLIVCCYNLSLRILWGIFTASLLVFSFLGILGVFIGVNLGNRVVNKIDVIMLKRITYLLIGVSGLTTFISAL
ncbi:MAG: sulfite exporter TauE/SafE family protein [Thomasclavelia sp.]